MDSQTQAILTLQVTESLSITMTFWGAFSCQNVMKTKGGWEKKLPKMILKIQVHF